MEAPVRVLIVEDEPLVAMLLEDMLADLGCEVVGPAESLTTALQLAADAEYDCAILDFSLAGRPSVPVADIVMSRGKPFAFASGYGMPSLGPEYASAAALPKPFRPEDVERLMSKLAPSAAKPSSQAGELPAPVL